MSSESSFIRERAREMGMTMRDLADRAGVSYGYLTHAARGHKSMGVKVQTRVESVLQAPVKIAPAQCGNRPETLASGGSSFIRERAPRPWHDHEGAGREGRRILRIPVAGVQGP